MNRSRCGNSAVFDQQSRAGTGRQYLFLEARHGRVLALVRLGVARHAAHQHRPCRSCRPGRRRRPTSARTLRPGGPPPAKPPPSTSRMPAWSGKCWLPRPQTLNRPLSVSPLLAVIGPLAREHRVQRGRLQELRALVPAAVHQHQHDLAHVARRNAQPAGRAERRGIGAGDVVVDAGRAAPARVGCSRRPGQSTGRPGSRFRCRWCACGTGWRGWTGLPARIPTGCSRRAGRSDRAAGASSGGRNARP